MRFLILTALFLISACSKDKNSSNPPVLDPIAESIESALNSISGVSDDASNENVVARMNPIDFFLSSAWADSCDRTLYGLLGNCNRALNCSFGNYTWTGSVKLDFDNGISCSLNGMGDFLLREVNFTRTGPRGSMLTTSDPRNNYEGNPIGGGIRVENVVGGVELDVLGQSKVLTSNRIGEIFDISMESLTPISMNQLARNGRTITAGTLDVYHNMAKFKASHAFQNVTWSSSCCYPTGGSIEVTISGSKTATGTVTFNGCGHVTTTFVAAKEFDLSNCE